MRKSRLEMGYVIGENVEAQEGAELSQGAKKEPLVWGPNPFVGVRDAYGIDSYDNSNSNSNAKPQCCFTRSEGTQAQTPLHLRHLPMTWFKVYVQFHLDAYSQLSGQVSDMTEAHGGMAVFNALKAPFNEGEQPAFTQDVLMGEDELGSDRERGLLVQSDDMSDDMSDGMSDGISYDDSNDGSLRCFESLLIKQFKSYQLLMMLTSVSPQVKSLIHDCVEECVGDYFPTLAVFYFLAFTPQGNLICSPVRLKILAIKNNQISLLLNKTDYKDGRPDFGTIHSCYGPCPDLQLCPQGGWQGFLPESDLARLMLQLGPRQFNKRDRYSCLYHIYDFCFSSCGQAILSVMLTAVLLMLACVSSIIIDAIGYEGVAKEDKSFTDGLIIFLPLMVFFCVSFCCLPIGCCVLWLDVWLCDERLMSSCRNLKMSFFRSEAAHYSFLPPSHVDLHRAFLRHYKSTWADDPDLSELPYGLFKLLSERVFSKDLVETNIPLLTDSQGASAANLLPITAGSEEDGMAMSDMEGGATPGHVSITVALEDSGDERSSAVSFS